MAATIRVLHPGAQTTVQDAGRHGYLHAGIPPSGPMDALAFRAANRLVGNPDGAAALECTLIGPRLAVSAPCAVAVTGADMRLEVDGREAPHGRTVYLGAGAVLGLGTARTGVRAYLAFSGGLDVPVALGSRSTYVRGRLGGHAGRALARGDELALFDAPRPRPRRLVRRPERDDVTELAVVLGPQDDRFTADGLAALLGGEYTVLPQSDRMGIRLAGPRIAHVRGHDIISDGIPLGGIQVPGDGQPIVLMVDRQSTGGYTKPATVCSSDIGRLAQVRPGGRVTFRAVTVAQAHARLAREETAGEALVVEEDA